MRDVLESFGANGKDAITVSQVLLHVGGFPYAQLGRDETLDRDARLAAYASWQTDWAPGSRFVYHPLSAHWVLADIIVEVTGRPYVDVIAERVMAPAGCSRWLGIAVDDQADVADVVGVGSAPTTEELAALGFDELPGTVAEKALLVFNPPWVRAVGVPGGGGIARAAEMARWYQAVLHNPDGFLHPDVRRDAQVVRQNHPDWTGAGANRSTPSCWPATTARPPSAATPTERRPPRSPTADRADRSAGPTRPPASPSPTSPTASTATTSPRPAAEWPSPPGRWPAPVRDRTEMPDFG